MVACGDDDGGDAGGGNLDGGKDSGSVDVGDGDGGSYTLADALVTAGTSVTAARAQLLFEAACKSQIKCDARSSQSDCEKTGLAMFNAGKSAGYDDACLDATLDLYACFAQNACADFDTACNSAGEAQDTACDKYQADGGN
jgi:hypothetical protein